MENRHFCAIEMKLPSRTYSRCQNLFMSLADFAQRYCVVQKNQGNERAAFGNVDKPSPVNYKTPRYGRPQPHSTETKLRCRQSSSTYRLNHFHRNKFKELCHYSSERGHYKRERKFFHQEKQLSQALFVALTDSSLSGESSGKNEFAVKAICNGALAKQQHKSREGH